MEKLGCFICDGCRLVIGYREQDVKYLVQNKKIKYLHFCSVECLNKHLTKRHRT